MQDLKSITTSVDNKQPQIINLAQMPSFDGQKPGQNTKKEDKQCIYSCKCGKSYKSYAAVYTHIKNKHNRSKLFLDSISRPDWVKTQKGRPRKFKEFQDQINDHTLKNQCNLKKKVIIEIGEIQIWDLFQEQGKKINRNNLVLELDQERDQQKIRQQYNKIIQQYGEPAMNIFEKFESEYYQFYLNFTQHTASDISARILWTLNTFSLSDQQHFLQEEQKNKWIPIDNETLKKVWHGNPLIGLKIKQIYNKWRAA